MTIDSRGCEWLYGMIHDSQFCALVNHVSVLLIIWHDSSAMLLLKYFHPVKRARDDSGGLLDPSYSNISLPTIEAAYVKVRAVCESQDTPSRSPCHMPFTMFECILQIPKKVRLIYVYINYDACANVCTYRY